MTERTQRMRRWARALWLLAALLFVIAILVPAIFPEVPRLYAVTTAAIASYIAGSVLWHRSDPAFDWKAQLAEETSDDS
jgi:heme A synthase